MPTPLGLPERFHATLKADGAYWKLHADPGGAPARRLTPHDVYVGGHKVGPAKWSRWVD
jgi:hypothetical protein